MDLSYSSEEEGFRDDVVAFLKANWPLTGDEAKLSLGKQASLVRERAIEAGFLYRNIPRKYGGSEQEPDVVTGQIIRE